jgi:hypothetical protein
MIMDTDGSGTIDEAEIAKYLHKILHLFADLAGVVLDIARALITKEITDPLVAIALTQAKEAGMLSDATVVTFQEAAPLFAMIEVGLSKVREQAAQNPQQAAMMAAQKSVVEKQRATLVKHAVDGRLNFEQYLAAQEEAVADAISMIANSVRVSLPPPVKMFLAMAEAKGFAVDAAFGRMMTMKNFSRCLAATFTMFQNADGTCAVNDLTAIGNIFLGNSPDGKADATPEERSRALFGLLDKDSDGTLSVAELGKMVGSVLDMVRDFSTQLLHSVLAY